MKFFRLDRILPGGKEASSESAADGATDRAGDVVADDRTEVDPEHVGSHLERSLAEREIDAKLAEVEDRERALEARRTSIRERREESAARAVAADRLRERIAGSDERLAAIEGELEAAEAERKQVRDHGLLSYALIFGAAAISFILADVVITRTIVADALALTGRTFLGIDESWFFASALALLAVLFKPAYDRLVEARFWEGDRRRFVTTILVTSGFAVATLFVLGMFRAVAFEARTMGELALQAPGADTAEQWTVMRDLQADVVASWWGKLAFVMSGILFAVAGAICLGIGLRHFHDFVHVRRPLGRRRRKLRRERKRLAKARKKDAAALTEARAELRRTEVRLGDLPGLERIQADVEAAQAERRELLERRTSIRRDRLERLYADGYGMGARLGDPTVAGRRRRPRPYVAVRRSIRAAFDGPDRDAGDPEA